MTTAENKKTPEKLDVGEAKKLLRVAILKKLPELLSQEKLKVGDDGIISLANLDLTNKPQTENIVNFLAGSYADAEVERLFKERLSVEIQLSKKE
jgi:hypothetical protein